MLRQRLGDFDAIEAGHLDVEQHDIGLELADRVARFSPVPALGDQLALGPRRHHSAQSLAREWLVVGNDDGVLPTHAAAEAGLSGICTITRDPPLEPFSRLSRPDFP